MRSLHDDIKCQRCGQPLDSTFDDTCYVCGMVVNLNTYMTISRAPTTPTVIPDKRIPSRRECERRVEIQCNNCAYEHTDKCYQKGLDIPF